MSKIIRWVFTYFFPVLMIDYYLIMRGVNLNTILMLPIFALLGIKAIVIAFKFSTNQFVMLMNCFLLYSLLTGFFYLFNDTPFNCYTNTLREFVFPIMFAYLGCVFSKDDEFFKWYIIACAGCFVIGFYLYLAGPDYYTIFLNDVRQNLWYAGENKYLDETNILEYMRFSSFFTTSYAISFFSIPALTLSLSYAISKNRPISKPWCYVFAIASFLAALLCQQRISIAFAFIVIIFFGFFSKHITPSKKKNSLWLVYFVVIVIAIFIFDFIAQTGWYERVSGMVGARFNAMSFSKAMLERTGQYSSFDRATGFSYIFGLGLGSCGHLAGAAGLRAIHDGEFVKLFYEFGFVGCSILLGIIVFTLIRGIKFFKLYYAEVIIIIFYLAAGIGSDSLTFFIFSVMFWFSMGRIWNKELFVVNLSSNS